MSAVYTCGRCGRGVTKTTRICPHCGARLAGIKCQSCGFVGSETDFAGDRCPKCRSVVHVPRPRPSAPSKPRPRPSAPSKPYVPGLALALLSVILAIVCAYLVLPIFLGLYVALKAEKKAAKVLGWVAVSINAVLLLVLLAAR